MDTKIAPFDAAEHLHSDEDIFQLLLAAFEDGDQMIIRAALEACTRAKGIAIVAEKTGLSEDTLAADLSLDGDPSVATVIQVLNALGYKLTVDHIATPPPQ